MQGSPGRVDPFFNTAFGVDQPVRILGVLDTGEIIIFGPMTDAASTTQHRIARLHSDGRLDRVLDVVLDVRASLDSFALLPDGRILAAAEVIVSPEVARQGILRLLPTGGIDSGFRTPPWVPRRMRRQADGRILVELADGQGIVRLNDDGSLDDAFRPKPDAHGVALVGPQADGRILASRVLVVEDGADGIELIRLTINGEPDPTFAGWSSIALSGLLAGFQPDGGIVLGGFQRNPELGVFRLHPDGSLNSAFDARGAISRDSVDDSWLRTIAVGPEGTIYIGGAIETKHPDFMSGDDAYEQGYVRRLDARHGREDRTFDVRLSGSWPGRHSSVEQIVVQPDGRLLIGGTFTVVNGAVRRFLARLDPDGRLDAMFNANQGADAAVQVLLPLKDGSLVVGGGPMHPHPGLCRR